MIPSDLFYIINNYTIGTSRYWKDVFKECLLKIRKEETVTLHVPLLYWHSRDIWSAIPLVAFRYLDLQGCDFTSNSEHFEGCDWWFHEQK